jgi:hypothetical protein
MKVSAHGSRTTAVNTLEQGRITPLGCARARSRMMVSVGSLTNGPMLQQGRWLASTPPFQERT